VELEESGLLEKGFSKKNPRNSIAQKRGGESTKGKWAEGSGKTSGVEG